MFKKIDIILDIIHGAYECLSCPMFDACPTRFKDCPEDALDRMIKLIKEETKCKNFL